MRGCYYSHAMATTTNSSRSNAQALTPEVDATYDVGTSALRYRNAFFSGAVTHTGDINMPTPNSALTVGVYNVNGLPFMHSYDQVKTNTNVFVGSSAGANAANMTKACVDNTGIGRLCLNSLADGALNTFIGSAAGEAVTTGNVNTGVGAGALNIITSGFGNIALGATAGNSYGSENNNICIGNQGIGGDSGTVRIGTTGTHTDAYIAGNVRPLSNLVLPISTLAQTAGYLTQGGNLLLHTYDQSGFQSNTFLGAAAGANIASMTVASTNNVGVGVLALNRLTTATQNAMIGYGAGQNITSGSFNNGMGFSALNACTIGFSNCAMGINGLWKMVDGTYNVAVGTNALNGVVSGTANTAIGNAAGSQYTSNESNNVCISNIGVVGDNNLTRLGTVGIHTSAYIAGTVRTASGVNGGNYISIYGPVQQTFVANTGTATNFTSAAIKIATAGITTTDNINYKVAVTGLYRISASMAFTTVPSTVNPNSVWILHSGDAAVYGISYNDNGAASITSCTATVYMTANDTFSVNFASPGTTTIAGSINTRLTAELGTAL